MERGMIRSVCVFALIGLVGCSRTKAPTEKYFSGQPVAHWLEAVRSPDVKDRKHAVEVLGNVGPADPGAIPALIVALADKDARIRESAVLGLSKIGAPAKDAIPTLTDLKARDPDARVRAAADRAITQVQSGG